MTNFVVIDTETTGLILPNVPLLHEDQPRMVQLGAISFDETGRELASLNTLITPEGWEIDEDDAPVHPWTTEDCEFMGMPAAEALGSLRDMAASCDYLVAHHAAFDLGILEIEEGHHGFSVRDALPSALCTMRLAMPVCRLPFYPGKFKYPSLDEAALLLLGRTVDEDDGLHDAFFDARLTKDIFLNLLQRGAVWTDDVSREAMA
jgi:DNA polymerase III subunit epsilon